MENQNIDTKQLENSSIPFVNHFSKLRKSKMVSEVVNSNSFSHNNCIRKLLCYKRFCIITI